jgi:integrase
MLETAAQRQQQRASDSSEESACSSEQDLHELQRSRRPVVRFLSGRNARPHSMVNYRRAISRLRDLLEGIGFKAELSTDDVELFPWHRLTVDQATAFSDHVYSTYGSVKAAQNRCSLLRSLLQESFKSGLLGSGQLMRLREALPIKASPPISPGRALTEKELNRLLSAAGSISEGRICVRDQAVIATLAGTGMRLSEITDLELADLHLNDRTVDVNRTKTGASRIALLPEACLPYLEAWVSERGDKPGPLFDSANTPGCRLAPGGLAQRIEKVSRKAGVKATSHDFRRTYVTTLLRNGTDPFTTARLVGHKNAATTMLYDRRTTTEDRAIVDSIEFGPNRRPTDG